MIPPPDAHDTPNSTYWFDKDGVLCVVSKDGPEMDSEERKKVLSRMLSQRGGEKLCMLIDITHARPSSRDSRAFNSRAFPGFVKAVAFLSDSALGRMMGHLYFGFQSASVPSRVFSSETEAREWLKQFR